MCSSPKSSSVSRVKKVSTSPLTHSELNNFVSIANASDARREERERVEQERLARESVVTPTVSTSSANDRGFGLEADQKEGLPYVRFLRSVHVALTASRSWA